MEGKRAGVERYEQRNRKLAWVFEEFDKYLELLKFRENCGVEGAYWEDFKHVFESYSDDCLHCWSG
jgi:hypothetical protein